MFSTDTTSASTVSGVVVDQAFTLGCVDINICLFTDHCCENLFPLNLHGCLDCQNYREIFLIYGILGYL